MTEVLNVIAIIVAGLMVGSELAMAAFVHPTLDRLPDEVHLPAASALARVQGRFMPPWYILVFLVTSAEVVIQWHQYGRLPICMAISALSWMFDDFVFGHRPRADQQPYQVESASRLEDVPP